MRHQSELLISLFFFSFKKPNYFLIFIDILLNVFLAIAVDNLADAESLTAIEKQEEEAGGDQDKSGTSGSAKEDEENAGDGTLDDSKEGDEDDEGEDGEEEEEGEEEDEDNRMDSEDQEDESAHLSGGKRAKNRSVPLSFILSIFKNTHAIVCLTHIIYQKKEGRRQHQDQYWRGLWRRRHRRNQQRR